MSASSADASALLAPLRGLLGETSRSTMSVLYASPGTVTSAASSPSQVRIARCSWCLCETAHARVAEGLWLARAAHKCGGCSRRTLPCRRPGCGAFARGHGDESGGDEDFCAAHGAPRLIENKWPDSPAEFRDARALLEPKGRCSWCLEERRHAFVRGETHACGGCARPTRRCRGNLFTKSVARAETRRASHSCDAFAKGDERSCAKCSGLVYDWTASRANAAATRREGWCSWCGERCAHLARRRRTEDGTVECECLVCGGSTAECASCPGVMRALGADSRGPAISAIRDAKCAAEAFLGSVKRVVLSRGDEPPRKTNASNFFSRRQTETEKTGDETARFANIRGYCVRCDARASFPSPEEAAETWRAFETRRVAADVAARQPLLTLKRRSRYQSMAHEFGLWRPFALLATLPPRERVRLGMRLGVRLARTRGYLDPHAEAWHVLTHPRLGLCARASAKVGAESQTLVDYGLAVVERFARDATQNPSSPDRQRKKKKSSPRANWLEVLAATLAAGAETGACPALDPRDAHALPRLGTRRAGFKALQTPRAGGLVAAYEEAALELAADAQRGRLTSHQAFVVDRLCAHELFVTHLVPRLKETRAAEDPERVARAAVVAAFAASPWARRGALGADAETVDRVAEDVFACLLRGVPPRRETEHEASVAKKKTRDDENGNENGKERASGVESDEDDDDRGEAVNLLAALAAASTARTRFFSPLGRTPLRTPAEAPRGAAGLFEPVAVMLVQSTLLAARGVTLDEYHPGVANRREKKSTDGSNRSPDGVLGSLGGSRGGSRASEADSEPSSLDRVARWAAAAADAAAAAAAEAGREMTGVSDRFRSAEAFAEARADDADDDDDGWPSVDEDEEIRAEDVSG